MAWIPQLIVTGGMMGGFGIPDGVLQGFLNDYILGTSGHGISRSGSMMRGIVNDSEATSWRGKFGLNIFSQLRDYAENHVGSTTQDFTLAEITVQNPEGAQYYKQTLALVVNVGSPEYDETEDYKVLLFTPYWMKIQRREYATPYADSYTSTDINDYYAGMTGCAVLEQGDEEDAHFFFTDSLMVGAGTFSYDGDDWFGFNYYMQKHRWDGEADRTSGAIFGIEMSQLNDYFGGVFIPEEKDDPNEEPEPDPDNPNPGPGGGGGGGGEGDHTLPDEGVPVPGLPEYSAAGVEWLTVYKMTQFQINEFGRELIDPDVWTVVKSFFTDPLDAIVGILLVPCDAPTTRTRQPQVGGGITGHTWPNAYPVVSTEFVEVDCGQIRIDPYWDSAFDFDPYTKFSLFLPFCGFKAIKADDIMGCNLGVKYHVNVMTGDCTAFVFRNSQSASIYGPRPEQVIGEYNGNCGVRVPIGRLSHDATIDASMRLLSTGIGMLGGAIAGQVMGDPMNISASQISNQISGATMTTVNGLKQGIERSGALGGSAGYMGNLKPYIIRTIPKQFLPDNYKQLNGYPANKGGTLSHYIGTGFQAIETIQLNNLPAFDSEIDEIRTLLKGGVLV